MTLGLTELTEAYSFNLSDRFSWHNFDVPEHDRSLVEAVSSVGETIQFKGETYSPYRVIWGGSERVWMDAEGDVPAGYYLKYQLCTTPDYRNQKDLLDPRNIIGFQWRNDLTGYVYNDPLTGEQKHVLLEESVPAELRLTDSYKEAWRRTKDMTIIPGDALVLPIMREPEEIGLPRWIVEKFMLPHQHPEGASGYFYSFAWQGDDIDHFIGYGSYKPLDPRIIEVVEAMYHFDVTATPKEKKEFAEKARKKEAVAAKKLADDNWDQKHLAEDTALALEEATQLFAYSISDEDLMRRYRKIIEKRMENL